MEKHGWLEDRGDSGNSFSYYYHKNELLISLQKYDTNNYLIRFTIHGLQRYRITCQAHNVSEAQAIAIKCYKGQLNKLIRNLPA
jgi:hypothetical protein